MKFSTLTTFEKKPQSTQNSQNPNRISKDCCCCANDDEGKDDGADWIGLLVI